MLKSVQTIIATIAALGIAACSTSSISSGSSDGLHGNSAAFVGRFEALKTTSPSPDIVVTYTSDTGKTFPINVYHPARECPVGGNPALVMYHGGGWKGGEPTQFRRQAKIYTELGFTLIMPAYSLERVDNTPPQQAASDAVEAWKTIVSSAEALCLDVSRMGAGGGSAGGHLGASLVTISNERASGIGERPKFLVLFNPVIDNGPDGFGYDRVGDDWTWFSPIHNIPDNHPDTLFLLGDKDRLIPVSTGEEYCRQVRTGGADCQLIVYEDAEHGWFNDEGFVDTLIDSAQFLSDWLAKHEN